MAVNLVAQAPVFDTVRLRVAVLAPQIGVVCVRSAVAIFHPVGSLFDGSGAEIDTDVRLGVDGAAVSHEFVGAEVVWLDRIPGRIEAPRPLIFGADAVL